MSVSIGIILVVVTAVIAAIALAPAVAPAEPDQAATRSGGGDARRAGRSRHARRRLHHIPPQQTGDRRRSFG